MALDWSQCPAVESIPGKVSGAWVFRGTRMPVATVFENLEDGMTIDEVVEQFDVTREQIRLCWSLQRAVLMLRRKGFDACSFRPGHAARDCRFTARTFG